MHHSFFFRPWAKIMAGQFPRQATAHFWTHVRRSNLDFHMIGVPANTGICLRRLRLRPGRPRLHASNDDGITAMPVVIRGFIYSESCVACTSSAHTRSFLLDSHGKCDHLVDRLVCRRSSLRLPLVVGSAFTPVARRRKAPADAAHPWTTKNFLPHPHIGVAA